MTHGMWEQPRFHKWSHTLRSQCHPVVNWLQDRGILVHRSAHLRHHKPPFETNYCIVTGHMNPILDRRRAAKPALWCSQKGSHSLVLEKKNTRLMSSAAFLNIGHHWIVHQPTILMDFGHWTWFRTGVVSSRGLLWLGGLKWHKFHAARFRFKGSSPDLLGGFEHFTAFWIISILNPSWSF